MTKIFKKNIRKIKTEKQKFKKFKKVKVQMIY